MASPWVQRALDEDLPVATNGVGVHMMVTRGNYVTPTDALTRHMDTTHEGWFVGECLTCVDLEDAAVADYLASHTVEA